MTSQETKSYKTPLDLIDLQYVFMQNSLLTVNEFRDACSKRGVRFSLADEQLEAFHRAGVLVPLYRVTKDVREARRVAREHNRPAWLTLSQSSRWLRDLKAANAAGRVRDPRNERFVSWRRYMRVIDEHKIATSEFLYSPYQLLLADDLRSFTGAMAYRKLKTGERQFRLKLSEFTQLQAVDDAKHNNELLIALTSLDRIYRPAIIGTFRPPSFASNALQVWQAFVDAFDPVDLLHWLGWTTERVRKEAEALITRATFIDPLEDWLDLVRLCRPSKWEDLRGDALIAMDHRIAAEMLLLFYEDLVAKRVAEPLPIIPRLAPHPLRERLQTDHEELDAVLMDYGLSPHPSLALLLEGETELLLVPRVMDEIGISRRPSFIELYSLRGTSGDVVRLASLVAPLSLGEARNNAIELTRPPTRFLTVFDAENQFADAISRESKRQKWVDELTAAVSKVHQKPVNRDDIDWLVQLYTWDEGCFEFAHFTNHEIVEAIMSACRRLSITPPWTVQEQEVEQVRRSEHKQNVRRLWSSWGKHAAPLTKLELAEELWPILQQKIRHAAATYQQDAIPVVKMLYVAVDLARSVLRSDVIVRLSSQEG